MTRSNALRPAWALRLGVWGGLALLGLSGLGLLPAEWFDAAPGAFPWEAWRGWVAPLHGALTLLFTLLLGALVPHVRAGWAAQKNQAWGVGLLGCLGLLLSSAWGLYYLPPEWLSATGKAHAAAGLLLPLLVWAHAAIGRRNKKRP